MPPAPFHPLIATWFANRFGEPTEPQRLGWPHIAAGRNTLIAAPTGSGKTLAAFLSCINQLFEQSLAGTLENETQVVYVSPLKALSNDVRRNLESPLEEIRRDALAAGFDPAPIRALVRTGDTPASERAKMLRRPPHILVTTPESLYLLLTSGRAREPLRSVRTVIVDEIHALARDKRGSHLALSLERLEALCQNQPVRIGLSATQRPIEEIARFLVGSGRECEIVDAGHLRTLDLAVDVLASELEAICSNEMWAEVYGRITELVQSHRSTLIFVNTRRLAERVTHRLTETLGEDAVASHHGSLAREIRQSAEERLKQGQLKAIVATASLEMGIDVGYIDLVCQIGSPRSIATLLQRVGRAGHSLGAVPKGRLFPLCRDELMECLALVRAVRHRRLDQVEIPKAPLDILAQQIVAATAIDEWSENELYELVRRAHPFRDLPRESFDRIVQMLAEGIAPSTKHGAHLHRDAINGRLRARRGARIAAVTSGGAIPEMADYRVVTEEGTYVGTVNEDFAIESMAGDVFLLGNTSWRVRQVKTTEVLVADAQGAPATIPFWLGEAPGRTIELSTELSTLREGIASRIDVPPLVVRHFRAVEQDGRHESSPTSTTSPNGHQRGTEVPHGEQGAPHYEPNRSSTTPDSALRTPHSALAPLSLLDTTPDHAVDLTKALAWVQSECNASEWAAEQAARYVAAEKAALGVVPTRRQIVFERFFDESGGMQLVIHAPLGNRINRAWGLALRKRFCRSFDFELQAAADDDGVVLSLGPQHSFPIDALFKMLSPANGQYLLTQALLAAPMFQTRWRWNITRALAVLRSRNGKKVPPNLQRMRSDDLLAAVFPQTVGCLENHSGDIEIPDHPLVAQTIDDCLHEAMDLDRWLDLLREVERGDVEFLARDTREPSPFSHKLLNSNPYTFLDDAPLEERRARAVATRRSLSIESVRDLGQLDPEAIKQVAAEAWPLVRSADELHDALLTLVVATADEAAAWRPWLEELIAAGRATTVGVPALAGGMPLPPEGGTPIRRFVIAAERWPLVRSLYTSAIANPAVQLPPSLEVAFESAAGSVELVRGRLQCSGPQTAEELAGLLGLPASTIFAALEALEGQGVAMRGSFTSHATVPLVVPPSGGNRSSESTITSPPEVGTTNGVKSRVEWCDRRLLARIHRRTLDGLRRKIQPVEPVDYLRFLMRHQRVLPDFKWRGRAGVAEAITQLQGFEIAAGSWESGVLPARVQGYDPAWLDELSYSGQLVWGRLRPPRKDEGDLPTGTALNRSMPLSLLLRENLAWLLPVDRVSAEDFARSNARLVLEALLQRGALFPHEIAALTQLLPAQVTEALHELAALGLATADAFATVRTLVASPRRGRPDRIRLRVHRDRPRRPRGFGAPAGRWSLFPGLVANGSTAEVHSKELQLLAGAQGTEVPYYQPHDHQPRDRLSQWAWQLLNRWGVVFRDLLAREPVAPSWPQLVGTFRRMEARGEIRGGRFIEGVGGEQYALSKAVEALRQVRDEAPSGQCVVISAADPLNLTGILTDVPRVPSTHTNSLALRDGRFIATQQAGEIQFHADVASELAVDLSRKLRRTG